MKGKVSPTHDSFHHPALGHVVWHPKWQEWTATLDSEDGAVTIYLPNDCHRHQELLKDYYNFAKRVIECKEEIKKEALLLISEGLNFDEFSEEKYLAEFALLSLDFSSDEPKVQIDGGELLGWHYVVAYLDAAGNITSAGVEG